MKLIAIVIICLIGNVACSNLTQINSVKADWKCVEYGPVKSDKPDGSQEALYTHPVAYDKLKDFSDNKYTIEDILHQVEPQYNASSQAMFTDDIYHELPMICTHNDTNTISTLKFIHHPHVYKQHYEGNQEVATKTETVLFHMKCAVFRLHNHTHAENFTWSWTRTNDHRWVPVNLTDANYKVTFDYADGINYNSTLTIRSVNLESAGKYACSAVNQYGRNNLIFELKVLSFYTLALPFISVAILVALSIFLTFVLTKCHKKKHEEIKGAEYRASVYNGQSVNA